MTTRLVKSIYFSAITRIQFDLTLLAGGWISRIVGLQIVMAVIWLPHLQSQAGILKSCEIPAVETHQIEDNLEALGSEKSLLGLRDMVVFVEEKAGQHHQEKIQRLENYRELLQKNPKKLKETLQIYKKAIGETRRALSMAFAPSTPFANTLNGQWAHLINVELKTSKLFPIAKGEAVFLSKPEQDLVVQKLKSRFEIETAGLRLHIRTHIEKGKNAEFWRGLQRNLESPESIEGILKINNPYLKAFYQGVLSDHRASQKKKVRNIVYRSPILGLLAKDPHLDESKFFSAFATLIQNNHGEIDKVQEQALAWTDSNHFQVKLNRLRNTDHGFNQQIIMGSLEDIAFIFDYVPLLEVFVQSEGQEICSDVETLLARHYSRLKIKNKATLVAFVAAMAVTPFLGPVPLMLGSAGASVWTLHEMTIVEKEYLEIFNRLYTVDYRETVDPKVSEKILELERTRGLHMISLPLMLLPGSREGIKGISKTLRSL